MELALIHAQSSAGTTVNLGRATSTSDKDDPRAIEELKFELCRRLEDHKFALSEKLEAGRLRNLQVMAYWGATFEYAKLGISTVVLVNGAAVTATLTLLGIVEKSQRVQADGFLLGAGAGAFAFGVLAGFLATIFAFLNQYQQTRSASQSSGPILIGIRWERKAALVSVFIGLAAFFAGVTMTAKAYLGL